MRLGTSSPLRHDSPKDWAENQVKLGCGAVVFPVQSNEPEEKIIAYKEAADKAGLTIAEVGIWRNALSLDEAERKANMDYCVEQLRLADFLHARFPFHRTTRWKLSSSAAAYYTETSLISARSFL